MNDTQTIPDHERWAGIYKLLDRTSLIHPEFEPNEEIKKFIKECKILVIGAGGLGCEILKNLALSGFRDIHVIDMDTIDVSNLNRQFLFRRADVGKPKAVTAAEFINKRVQGVTVTPHYCKIQDKDEDFYQQFALVICGLDSIEARRWINATLVGMSEEGNPDMLKPLIDGGTEGFKGQARVILPGISSCYECSMDMLSKPTGFPLCTIANTPRLPEHCIEWASVLEWPNKHGERKMDTDDPKDIQWLYETALARAKQYNIQGVTYSLTQGVVKNIIPAIAATNAIIAASCCNEALKLASSSAKYLDNYMMYSGNDSVYTYTFQHQRKEDCPVCSETVSKLEFGGDKTLEDFMEYLKEKPDVQLKRPSFAIGNKPLYMQAPKQLEEAMRPNLSKPLKELFSNGDQVTITDSTLPFNEAALYDRQIRLWGLEAQHRMRNASILIAGMRALSNEVCKNIILAGVGSITLLEHETVVEEDLGAQFLIRHEDIGRNRAEAAAERARHLNPRVKVIVDQDDIAHKPDSYFTQFNIVCLTGVNPDQLLRIDNACRGTKTGLYAARTHGFFGYIFCDLTHHEYREESQEPVSEKGKEPETTISHKSQDYDSLSSTMQTCWGFPKPRVLKRKVSPLFFAIQVLWLFQQENNGRLPQSNSEEDMASMFRLRDERLKTAQVDPTFVEDDLLQTLVSTATAEIAPVCAILGGFLAQDILKTLSGKDAPLLNYFLYNGLEGTGLVHHIQKTIA
ncbi:hypothetical protein EC968_009823 [Mortierella alpina]|nr:hypothetical protein EC968_009823 [Mortierella alpina]